MNEELLKGIINEENFDISLYSIEAEMFNKKIIGRKSISQTFLNFAVDEEKHIKILMKILNREFKIVKRKTIVFKSLRETLRRHLIREKDSIKLYEVLKDLTVDLNQKKMIEEIIENEKKHYSIIRKYLFSIG